MCIVEHPCRGLITNPAELLSEGELLVWLGHFHLQEEPAEDDKEEEADVGDSEGKPEVVGCDINTSEAVNGGGVEIEIVHQGAH